MKKNTHHIRKQQVDLEFETEKRARYWNNRFADFYYDDILPQFSSLLDETIPDDHSFVIDRLEIDLGRIQMEEFRTVFLEKAEEEIKRILKKGAVSGSGLTAGEIKVEDHASEDIARKDFRKSRREDRKGQSKRVNNLQIKDSTEHLLESFYYFLDHGVLPWNSEVDTITDLETDIRREVGLEKLTRQNAFLKRMRMRSIRQRLYFQFSRIFVDEIFNLLYSDELDKLLPLKEELEKQLDRLAKDASARKEIKHEFSEGIWPLLIVDGPADTHEWSEYYVRSITENLSDLLQSARDASVFESLLNEISSSSPLSAYLRSIIHEKNIGRKDKQTETHPDEDGTQPGKHEQKGLSENSSEDNYVDGDDESSMDTVDDRDQELSEKKKAADELDAQDKKGKKLTGKSDETDGEHVTDSAQDEKTKKQERDSESVEIEKLSGEDPSETQLPDEGLLSTDLQQKSDVDNERVQELPDILEEYYIRNAGIVLCWPYLSRLFTNLGYLDDQTFKEPYYQQRAVHLLGYLGSGEGQCEEHDLVLSKFLTAWPLQMPIIKELELTENEKSSADEMLDSLISHWSVLKNTSVEGLRESFFHREGKLFKEDEHWRLIVEQESYDMLLDRLPYNIALIKLPWMEKILKVDWV